MCFKNSPRGYTHTETDSLSFFEPSSSEGKKRPEPPPIFLYCFSLNKGKHISDRITCFSWTPLNARLLLKCRTPPNQRSKLGNQPWLFVKENESESCHKSTCNGSLEHLPGWKDPPASFTLRFAFPLSKAGMHEDFGVGCWVSCLFFSFPACTTLCPIEIEPLGENHGPDVS